MRKILLLTITLLTTTLFSYSQCSYISGILVHACTSDEGINEMVTIQVGTTALNWNDISITFPNGGIYCNTCTRTWTTNSDYVNDVLEASCPEGDLIFELGVDGNVAPAGARIIVFTGIEPSYEFDFSNLCGTGPYYVMFANSTATTGRFANSGGDRTTEYDLGGCEGDATYEASTATTGTGGDGVIFDEDGEPTYVNSCNAIPLINDISTPMVLDKTKTIHTQSIHTKTIENNDLKIIMSIHNLIGQELFFYDYNTDNIIDINMFKEHGTLIIRYTDLTAKKIIIK